MNAFEHKFLVEEWDHVGNHWALIAGCSSFKVAVAAYEVAIEAEPKRRIRIRNHTRVIRDTGVRREVTNNKRIVRTAADVNALLAGQDQATCMSVLTDTLATVIALSSDTGAEADRYIDEEFVWHLKGVIREKLEAIQSGTFGQSFLWSWGRKEPRVTAGIKSASHVTPLNSKRPIR